MRMKNCCFESVLIGYYKLCKTSARISTSLLVTDKALGHGRHLIHLKEITHSAHCFDQLIFEPAVEFVAEGLDIDVDNIGIGLRRHVPYALRKGGAGMRLSRIFDKKLKQRKLTRRQVDVPAVSFDPALAAMQHQLA